MSALRARGISAAKAEAGSLIDAAAGRARLRYITDVPGQQAVYLVKNDEASAYLASVVNGVPTATPGPHLVAEAAVRGITAMQMAQLVAGLAATWTGSLSPAIEAARMAGKLSVDAAADRAAVESALALAVAALEAL